MLAKVNDNNMIVIVSIKLDMEEEVGEGTLCPNTIISSMQNTNTKRALQVSWVALTAIVAKRCLRYKASRENEEKLGQNSSSSPTKPYASICFSNILWLQIEVYLWYLNLCSYYDDNYRDIKTYVN